MSEAKFKVGDRVRCLNPTHPGENPFVVAEYDSETPPTLFYPVGNLDSEVTHDNGWVGCIESELILADAPSMEGKQMADADILWDAIKFAEKVGPLPRCVHGSALLDGGGEKLEPRCGCRYPQDHNKRAKVTSIRYSRQLRKERP